MKTIKSLALTAAVAAVTFPASADDIDKPISVTAVASNLEIDDVVLRLNPIDYTQVSSSENSSSFQGTTETLASFKGSGLSVPFNIQNQGQGTKPERNTGRDRYSEDPANLIAEAAFSGARFIEPLAKEDRLNLTVDFEKLANQHKGFELIRNFPKVDAIIRFDDIQELGPQARQIHKNISTPDTKWAFQIGYTIKSMNPSDPGL